MRQSSISPIRPKLSIEQNLTFASADKIFCEKEVNFNENQKQTLGLIRSDGRYSNLALILSDQCPYSMIRSLARKKLLKYWESASVELINYSFAWVKRNYLKRGKMDGSGNIPL